MAQKRTARKMTNDWIENRVVLKWTGASASSGDYADSAYIDVAEVLSALNRKLIRQGQLFRIRNFRIFSKDTTDNDLVYSVGIVPRTYATRNAWVKAKALWDQMNAMALNNGTITAMPKWHDFKVYMDSGHAVGDGVTVDGVAQADAPLLPVDFDSNAASTGEWAYSKFHDSASTSDEFISGFLGDHVADGSNLQYVGLIQAYGESRGVVGVSAAGNPYVDSDQELSPWAILFGNDDQTKDIIEDMHNDNDLPPYGQDWDKYPGGKSNMPQGHRVGIGRIQNPGSGFQSLDVPSFIAPCGLIRLEVDDADAFDATEGIYVTFDVDILGPMDA
tara:strand:+ start:796 stop:1791 length:996 start_codon:yes stop_codon:yes gene_type:complete